MCNPVPPPPPTRALTLCFGSHDFRVETAHSSPNHSKNTRSFRREIDVPCCPVGGEGPGERRVVGAGDTRGLSLGHERLSRRGQPQTRRVPRGHAVETTVFCYLLNQRNKSVGVVRRFQDLRRFGRRVSPFLIQQAPLGRGSWGHLIYSPVGVGLNVNGRGASVAVEDGRRQGMKGAGVPLVRIFKSACCV